MIKSMTGFSKSEAQEQGIRALVELKSVNGRYLEPNLKMPRSLSSKELDIREIIRQSLTRGSITVQVTIEKDATQQRSFINDGAAAQCYRELEAVRKKLKLREAVKMENILAFANLLQKTDETDTSEIEWKVASKAIREAIKGLNIMRQKEGQQIANDMIARVKNISTIVDKIEELSIARIPEEREKMRRKVAQLFEMDEIDERRIQMEIVVLSDKLDISEECVRLRSHIKFFFETIKSEEAIGRKLTFLLQEMNREINTIGSKANDAQISQIAVEVKEELERIREQAQNVE